MARSRSCKPVETLDGVGANLSRVVGVAVSVNRSSERVKRYVTEHLRGFTHFCDRRGQQDIDAAIRAALR